MENSRVTAERVARESYGKLLALLSSQSGDVASAEDALADAFAKALDVWPRDGVPEKPEAWLLTVARNRQKDRWRSLAHRTSVALDDDDQKETVEMALINAKSEPEQELPDERLKLLFVCAHPAIDPNIHTALMMQTVLGFEAADIASAYLVPESRLAQRLVRAKRKIRDAGIAFAIPQGDVLPERRLPVLEAIYGAYSLHPLTVPIEDIKLDLAGEALYLSSLLAELMPNDAEVLGLASLIALSHARSGARLDDRGVFVPLHQHDVTRWDADMVERGLTMLDQAEKLDAPGRFQIEAAIQAVHAERWKGHQIDWHAIVQLYGALCHFGRSAGALIGLASAVSHAHGGRAGLHVLDVVSDEIEAVERFQPFWATKAFAHRLEGNMEEAQAAYEKAISLTTEIAIRRWLEEQKPK